VCLSISEDRFGSISSMSKEFFAALLETFAREAGAGVARIILLVLDNAGWHSAAAGLKIPDGIHLVYLPPYSPELQPAETLWALVDEPIVNKQSRANPAVTPFRRAQSPDRGRSWLRPSR
jgi:transposase